MEPTSVPTLVQAPAEPSAAPVPHSFLWRPNLIVFLASACMMTLELVAGRIIAPYVGVSLYTWTSVIGIVLAGMSLGNYLGGRLADRYASLRLLGLVFLIGGLSCFLILAVDILGDKLPGSYPIVLRILILTGALFLLPSIVLGAISPVVVKLAVRNLARTGRTVGSIYAMSTVGSIVGTFATGFVLISWFGTHAIVMGVAVVLLMLGLALLLGRRWLLLGASTLLVAMAGVFIWRQVRPHMPCTRETNYFCIKVREEDRDGQPVRVLILDRLVHSYTSLNDPTKLVYGYEQIYAEATAYRAQRDEHLSALFIGGGGYTFPRYMEALYPGSDIHVVEIDPGVTQIAYEYLGLRSDSGIVTFNEDARLFLQRQPTRQYDLILGDAFNDFSVPYHLTTKEFNERVHAWLEADGLYMVNLIDGPGGSFVRAYTHTLRQTFANVYLVPTISEWRNSSRTTFVLIASDAPLELDAFKSIDAGDGDALLARRVLGQRETDDYLAEGGYVLLTDQYAPVDQMLASVYREEVPR
ncbi:MAG: fused MFS/spermidine synthase [Anaerolineae bacterium]